MNYKKSGKTKKSKIQEYARICPEKTRNLEIGFYELANSDIKELAEVIYNEVYVKKNFNTRDGILLQFCLEELKIRGGVCNIKYIFGDFYEKNFRL